MEKVRTIFFGSGKFAVPIIEQLLNYELLELGAIVTQRDKPTGRNQELKPVPVKEMIEKFYPHVRVYAPSVYRNEQEQILESEKPELIIVADYGQLLPEFTINYAKYKCLNIHGSILPDLRGAVPIPAAILKGYENTGVSILVMTTGLDDGPVLATAECDIDSVDTTDSLKVKLSNIGAKLLTDILPSWINGELETTSQDNTQATFAEKSLISKDKAKITAETTVEEADKMLRAFYPWPISWCELNINNKIQRLKIFSAKPRNDINQGVKGEIIRDGKVLLLRLEGGGLELLEVQLEGKKKDTNNQYLFLAGTKLI